EHLRRMRREYDVAPSAALVRLHAQLKVDDAPPPSTREAPPVPAAGASPPLASSPVKPAAGRRRSATWALAAAVLALAAWIPVQRWRARRAGEYPVMAVGSIVEVV